MKHFVSFGLLCLFCMNPLFAQKRVLLPKPCMAGSFTETGYTQEALRLELGNALSSCPFQIIVNSDVDYYLNETDFGTTCEISDYTAYKIATIIEFDNILFTQVVKTENKVSITAKLWDTNNSSTILQEMVHGEIIRGTMPDITPLCEMLVVKINKALSLKPISETATDNMAEMLSEESVGQVKHFSDGSRGIVFYITNDRKHGLAVSLDASPAKWENQSSSRRCHDIVTIPNEDGTMFCTYKKGEEYTANIINQIGMLQAPAAAWAISHGTGWYLPSAGELWHLFIVANEGKGSNGPISHAIMKAGGMELTNDWYWSSTENDKDEAINVSISGRMSSEDKTEEIQVRAVRAF